MLTLDFEYDYDKHMNILISWVVSALAILVAAYILPGVQVQSLVTALVLAVVLGVINAFLKPLLVILTLPLNILTLGLFILVINAVLIMLAGAIVPGFTVVNFWWALLFGLVLSLINSFLNKFSR